MNSVKPIRMPNHVDGPAPDKKTVSASGSGGSAGRVAWLTVRVHADAFRFDPVGYLQAVGWRLRGLKVRSRNRIAKLAGRSPHAYDLWIARDEPKVRRAFSTGHTRSWPTIVPVIDCRELPDAAAETLASLRDDERGHCIMIGGRGERGIVTIGQPRELAGLIESSGTWICPLYAGDLLVEGARDLYSAAAANADGASLIYADDDSTDLQGRRVAPHFKPDWNPELFAHHDFLSGSAIVKATPDQLADLPDDRWIERLAALAVERGADPIHVPLVLHHRRCRREPVVPAKPVVKLDTAPSVSLIVPTRNQVSLLRDCIAGVRKTTYPRLATIVVDNGSDDPEALAFLEQLSAEGILVLREPGPFNFSALNNTAVQHARGDFLCFLNNDVEVLDADWLALMVEPAKRPEIGAVGARLLYPDGTVQHAGVCTGVGGGAGHAHRFQRADDTGYFERSRLPQLVTAVTAACLVVAKEKFLTVGGFDEEDFPVAFNDVDLCLKLNAKGWQSFYEPRATLIHHESKSRGSDAAKGNRVRFAGELAALKRKWGTDRHRDPYHHPQLSPFCEQFSIAV